MAARNNSNRQPTSSQVADKLDGDCLPAPSSAHLNLEWTVGDMERLRFMRFHPRMPLADIATKFHGTLYQCTTERLREIRDHFGVNVPGAHQ